MNDDSAAVATALASGRPVVSQRLIVLLAIACGATVANLYYAQPLLPFIARSFHTSDGTAGLLVTVSQTAYALGIIFIAPLGDLVDRRRLVVRLLSVSALGLGLAAAAPVFVALAAALAIACVASVAVQVLIPFASTLAPPQERGRVVGLVMSGTLTGILLARTVAGLLAGVAGWRSPFVLAAISMLLLAGTLARALPDVRPPVSLPYRRLLLSVAALVLREPVLRRRMVYGACGFAAFSATWTTVAFLLSKPPYGYDAQTIGLFGLAGLVGALGAQRLGRAADRGHGHCVTGGVLVLILVSWAVLALGATSIAAVVAGLVLIDFGVQGQNVLSQHAIFGLGQENASRVATAYVTSTFLGGAAGSVVGSIAWEFSGWTTVCGAGAVMAGLSLAVWLDEARRVRSEARVRPGA